MTKPNHWCDICCTAKEWVGVLKNNQGEYETICKECLALLLKQKERWQAEGVYSR